MSITDPLNVNNGGMLIMNNWNKSNTKWMILYAVLYAAGTAIVCVTGAIHPVLFVCYQITAGILLSGIIIRAFARVKALGAAVCLALGMLILLVVIKDAAAWHVIPVIVIAITAEIVRAVSKYSWKGDVISTAIMSFSSFGYYGQIWFNRDFTYEAAIEEMRAGYGDTLMAVSPAWALPVVVIIGIIASVIISNLTAKMSGLEK